MELIASFVDHILHLDKYLAVMLAQYGSLVYGILFAIIFCETGLVVAPFLPGDSLLFVAGALTATSGGTLDITTLCTVLLAAAVLGDNTNYWIGYALESRVFGWENSRFFNKAAFEKTHAFYEKNGGRMIVIARFLPLVRTFAPFVAGVARMTYSRFVLIDLFGGALWILSLTLGGYWFGNLPAIKNNLSAVILGIVGISLLPALLGYLRHRTSRA